LRLALPLAGLALLAVAAAGSPAEPPPAPTLEAFMAGMAGTSGVEARFREVKEVALLAEPLEVRGTLFFVPPDRLARVTHEPGRSRLVIDGERLSFEDEADGEAIDLSGNPVAREFVSNFIVLFNGDLEALRARYEPHFRVEGGRWSLRLVPRRRPLRDFVAFVRLEGEGRSLARMELVETDGDRTVTTFTEVEVDRRFGAEELSRLFAPPGVR
jgi:outer membrane lipoprotein-sorting protein